MVTDVDPPETTGRGNYLFWHPAGTRDKTANRKTAFRSAPSAAFGSLRLASGGSLSIERMIHVGLNDSKSSLDSRVRARENQHCKTSREKTLLQILMLERIEPEHNVHRYYVMSLEPTLLGDIGLRREWGRLGNKGGRTHLDLYEKPQAAREALEIWLQRKFKRGYRLRLVDKTCATGA